MAQTSVITVELNKSEKDGLGFRIKDRHKQPPAVVTDIIKGMLI